jgi:hypothetical protein
LAGGADQFKTLLGMFNPFQVVVDGGDDHDNRAVFFVATSAGSGLGYSHTDPFNQIRFCDTIGINNSTDKTGALKLRMRSLSSPVQ